MAIGDARIGGEVNTNGHDFSMIGFSDIVFDDEDNAVFRNTAVNLSATANMQIDTRLETQGGNLTMDIVGAFGQSATGEISTGGGNLNVTNGGGTTLSGTVTTAGGDVTAGHCRQHDSQRHNDHSRRRCNCDYCRQHDSQRHSEYK